MFGADALEARVFEALGLARRFGDPGLGCAMRLAFGIALVGAQLGGFLPACHVDRPDVEALDPGGLHPGEDRRREEDSCCDGKRKAGDRVASIEKRVHAAALSMASSSGQWRKIAMGE